MEGIVTAISDTSITLSVDTTAGSGSSTLWSFSIAGNVGAQGTQGVQGRQGPNGVVASISASAPGSPVTGTVWYDTDDSKTYVYDGTFWVEIGAAPTGAQGTQGVQGQAGTSQGTQGIQGTNGIGPVSSITANNAYTGTAEATITSTTIAANTMTAGATYKFSVFGVRTGATASTGIIRLRIGTTTLTGVIPATVTMASTATASTFTAEGIVTIRTAGATGTALGAIMSIYGTTVLLSQSTATVTVNTTVSNLMEVTFAAGTTGNTYTFYNAAVYRVF